MRVYLWRGGSDLRGCAEGGAGENVGRRGKRSAEDVGGDERCGR